MLQSTGSQRVRHNLATEQQRSLLNKSILIKTISWKILVTCNIKKILACFCFDCYLAYEIESCSVVFDSL